MLLALTLLVGLLCGASATLFLAALAFVTELRIAWRALVWFLPFVGFLMGAAYDRFGTIAGQGTQRVVRALTEGGHPLPRRFAPMVLLGTLATHLVGGSAGREGTAVQMGAGLADLIARRFAVTPAVRQRLLAAGVGGGFGAVFGTPVAGALFAAEFGAAEQPRWRVIPVALLAAAVGDATTRGLGTEHFAFLTITTAALSPDAFARWLLLGLAIGLVARAFVATTHALRAAAEARLPTRRLRLAAGGTLLLLLTRLLGSHDYLGLGLPLLRDAFEGAASGPSAFALKLLFTTVTIAAGFIGGEVTPLFVIGALAGRAAAPLLGLPNGAAAGVAMVALFGAAANAPLALIVMAAELFGGGILPAAALTTLVAWFVSGGTGIYGHRTIPLLARKPLHEARESV